MLYKCPSFLETVVSAPALESDVNSGLIPDLSFFKFACSFESRGRDRARLIPRMSVLDAFSGQEIRDEECDSRALQASRSDRVRESDMRTWIEYASVAAGVSLL